MVFTDPVSWRCDICHDKRTEGYLSVNTKDDVNKEGSKIHFEVRYCNDNPTCREKAAERVKRWPKSLYK